MKIRYIFLIFGILILVFLIAMVIGNKEIQIGKEFYGFTSNFGVSHYSWCQSQASPRIILNENDSYMELEKNKIEISSEKYNLSLSNPVLSTHSMNPSIPDGSKIIEIDLQNNKGFNYKIGDIVCFWNKGYQDSNVLQICHRIIEISNDKIKTRGDNNIDDDGWIEKGDVAGVIVGVIF